VHFSALDALFLRVVQKDEQIACEEKRSSCIITAHYEQNQSNLSRNFHGRSSVGSRGRMH